jgi:hypothetical protein
MKNRTLIAWVMIWIASFALPVFPILNGDDMIGCVFVFNAYLFILEYQAIVFGVIIIAAHIIVSFVLSKLVLFVYDRYNG